MQVERRAPSFSPRRQPALTRLRGMAGSLALQLSVGGSWRSGSSGVFATTRNHPFNCLCGPQVRRRTAFAHARGRAVQTSWLDDWTPFGFLMPAVLQVRRSASINGASSCCSCSGLLWNVAGSGGHRSTASEPLSQCDCGLRCTGPQHLECLALTTGVTWRHTFLHEILERSLLRPGTMPSSTFDVVRAAARRLHAGIAACFFHTCCQAKLTHQV